MNQVSCCEEAETSRVPQWIRNIWYRVKALFVKEEESNLIQFARMELEAIGYSSKLDKDDINKWIYDNVMELITVFSKQGHSGFSAPYAIELFTKLASYAPLSPLTGNPDEWIDVTNYTFDEDKLFQNKRCGHVFKDGTGKAWDINGYIFREPNGCTYTSQDSKIEIEFPYTPSSEYVDVDYDGKVLRNEPNDNVIFEGEEDGSEM